MRIISVEYLFMFIVKVMLEKRKKDTLVVITTVFFNDFNSKLDTRVLVLKALSRILPKNSAFLQCVNNNDKCRK